MLSPDLPLGGGIRAAGMNTAPSILALGVTPEKTLVCPWSLHSSTPSLKSRSLSVQVSRWSLLFPSLASLSPVQISLHSILEKFMNFWCTDGDLLFLHRGILLAPNCCYLFGPFTGDLGEGETYVPITISN